MQRDRPARRYLLEHRSWTGIAAQTLALYQEVWQLRRLRNTRFWGQRFILHTPEPQPSASLYVEELARALADEGIPVTVICPANHEGKERLENHPGVWVRACRARNTDVKAGLIAKALENIRFILSSCWALLRTARPGDIVHFQYVLHFPYGAVFFLCALLRRVTIFFTVHDPLPHKWLLPPRFRSFERGALAWAYRVSDVLIPHSEAAKNKLISTFQIDPDKISVVAHGPYELGTPLTEPPPSDRLEVLLFGSLRENKGHHLAIEAVNQLAAEGVAIRLTIAGNVVNRKEQAYWDTCEPLIGKDSPAFRLLKGHIPNSALPELFSSTHCFLLPYTDFSSDSGVAFIALSNGKPIVATGAGGLGWLLASSGGGVRIAEPSVAAVKTALRQAVALGPKRLPELGQTGKEWVLRECGWPVVARATRALYARYAPSLREEDVSQPELAAAARAAEELASTGAKHGSQT